MSGLGRAAGLRPGLGGLKLTGTRCMRRWSKWISCGREVARGRAVGVWLVLLVGSGGGPGRTVDGLLWRARTHVPLHDLSTHAAGR